MAHKDFPAQEPLFETPGIHLDPRAAFGRVPKDVFQGVNPAVLREQITDRDLATVGTDNLRHHVYSDNGKYSYHGVVFRPDEYEVLVRNHKAFGAAVIGKTLAARAVDHNLDRRSETAVRSGTHAFSSKLERIGGMITGYGQEIAQQQSLLKEMRSPGFAHMSEAQLRMKVVGVEQNCEDMLTTLALSYDWDNEKLTGAKKAMLYRFASEDYHANFRYWHSTTELVLAYTNARLKLAHVNARATERRANQQ